MRFNSGFKGLILKAAEPIQKLGKWRAIIFNNNNFWNGFLSNLLYLLVLSFTYCRNNKVILFTHTSFITNVTALCSEQQNKMHYSTSKSTLQTTKYRDAENLKLLVNAGDTALQVVKTTTYKKPATSWMRLIGVEVKSMHRIGHYRKKVNVLWLIASPPLSGRHP